MSDDFTPGSIVADKFRIERVLGQGGMGVVVLATHLQLDQRVALKFLLPNALRQPASAARFAREARAAAKIRSEHVARVIDVGTLDSGAPYIVMEYLEGRDLADSVVKQGAPAIAQAVAYILQACEALAEAHAAGIVHRDLKPSNMFVVSSADGTPCIKILDFGISKLTGGSGADLSMTDTATVMGSPFYMSPEQMRSTRDVDARSDIWALGVILYELVSGRVPFQADTMPVLCSLVLQEPPPPLQQFRADAPPGLVKVIARCLEKDPQRRFQSIAELAMALAEFAPADAYRSVERIARVAGVPMSSRGSDAQKLAAGVASTHLASSNTFAFSSATSRRLRGSLGITLAVAVLGGVAAWLWFRGVEPSASEPATLPGPEPAVALPAPSPAPAHASLPNPPNGVSQPAALPAAPAPAPTTVAPVPAAQAAKRKPRQRPRSKPATAPTQPASPATPTRADPNPLDGRH